MLRYWQYCHHDRFYSSCDMPMRADPAVPNSLGFFFLVLSDATAPAGAAFNPQFSAVYLFAGPAIGVLSYFSRFVVLSV